MKKICLMSLLFYLKCTALFANFCQYAIGIDYLFWNMSQTNMTYALIIDTIDALENPEAQNQRNEWGSGFRLNGFFNFNCFWDSHLSWTRLHNTNEVSTSTPVIVATQLFSPAVNFVIGGDGIGGPAVSQWNLKLDLLDLAFGFVLYDNSVFKLHPYLGVKGGVINQNQFIRYENFIAPPDTPVDATVNIVNDYWGVGPKIGLDSSLCMGYGFSVVGDFSLASFYGHHHSSATTEMVFGGTFGQDRFLSEKNRLMAMFQIYLGVEWNTCIYQFPTTIGVGYETQFFWNIWRIQNSSIQNFFITNAGFGDLMLNGLTAKVAISF